MKHTALLLLALAGAGPWSTTLATADCAPEAATRFAQGQAAYNEGRSADAAQLYTRAAESCDRHTYWMAAGEVWVRDVLAGLSAAAVRDSGQDAVSALENAYRSADTNAERIQAARGMVELGLLSDDPLNARSWLLFARNELDTPESELADLRTRIEQQEKQLTEEQISRGSGKGGALLFDPLRLSSLGGPLEFGGEGGGRGDREGEPAAMPPLSLNIPINFDSNSTVATSDTAGNIAALANALANDYSDARFRLVGHADARGEAAYNQTLSEQRAMAVHDALVRIRPELEGRIATVGKGESEPREAGDTPAAYRSNRRLEVFIEQ